jgi:hypothetical protein
LELYSNHFIRFTQSNTEKNVASARILLSGKKYYVCVSNYFYPHFAILASQKGKLSKRMLSKMKPFAPINDSIVNRLYKDNLIRKINLAEKNAQFLKKNNLKTGLIRYGFHF